MLKRLCQQQCLSAHLDVNPEFQQQDTRESSLSDIMLNGSHILREQLDPNEVASANGASAKSQQLEPNLYEAIFAHLQQRGESVQRRQDALNGFVLPGTEVLPSRLSP